MKNRLLGLANASIPYIPYARSLAGSIKSTVLMQQFEYRFALMGGKPFYKFLEPCDHQKYRHGDSWVEELQFSKEEFRTAFDNLGVRYKSKSQYIKTVNDGKNPFIAEDGTTKFYCSFQDKRSGLTFYIRNNSYTDAAIDEAANRFFVPDPQEEAEDIPMYDVDTLCRTENPMYVDCERQSTEIGNHDIMISEITTEITTENKNIFSHRSAQRKKKESVDVEEESAKSLDDWREYISGSRPMVVPNENFYRDHWGKYYSYWVTAMASRAMKGKVSVESIPDLSALGVGGSIGSALMSVKSEKYSNDDRFRDLIFIYSCGIVSSWSEQAKGIKTIKEWISDGLTTFTEVEDCLIWMTDYAKNFKTSLVSVPNALGHFRKHCRTVEETGRKFSDYTMGAAPKGGTKATDFGQVAKELGNMYGNKE